MSNLSQFIGGSRPPKSLVNHTSAGGVVQSVPTATKSILSGALTAATLKTLLTITGAGAIKFLGVATVDATSRTVRLKVTIDGVVVYDATSSAITSSSLGLIAIGSIIDAYIPQLDNVAFNSTLLVEVASSLSETDKLSLRTVYETR